MSNSAVQIDSKLVHVFQRTKMKARIDKVRFHDGVNYSIVTCPAVDEFSKPSVFEVRSKSRLGSVGEIVDREFDITGWPAGKFEYQDKNTGEIIQGQNYRMALDLVE